MSTCYPREPVCKLVYAVMHILFQSHLSPTHLFHTQLANKWKQGQHLFQSHLRGVQLTYLWNLENSLIVSRTALREKQEQVTWQLKSVPSFDQQSNKELMIEVTREQLSSK